MGAHNSNMCIAPKVSDVNSYKVRVLYIVINRDCPDVYIHSKHNTLYVNTHTHT